MKRNNLIIISALVIISLIIVLIVFAITNKQEEKKVNNGNPIPTVSEIELNSKQYINQLEKVKIKGTNDTIMITKQVKLEVPEHGEGVTVSFAIQVPYTITADGQEYNGTYQLGSSVSKAIDNNPKYDFEITNLTKDGDIEILIINK
jgi:hypothetical protein